MRHTSPNFKRSKTLATLRITAKSTGRKSRNPHALGKRQNLPGVDQTAYIKAGFLTAIAKSQIKTPLISYQGAVDSQLP
nr:hypothetical protein [Planktothricoides raciborskii]